MNLVKGTKEYQKYGTSSIRVQLRVLILQKRQLRNIVTEIQKYMEHGELERFIVHSLCVLYHKNQRASTEDVGSKFKTSLKRMFSMFVVAELLNSFQKMLWTSLVSGRVPHGQEIL